MSETIAVAIIALMADLIVTVITVVSSNNKTRSAMQTHMAVQDERMTNLTNEVKRHNEFAVRMPQLEGKVENLEYRIKRIEDDGK